MHNQPVDPVATQDVDPQRLRGLQLDVEGDLVLADQRVRVSGDRVLQLSAERPVSHPLRNAYTM